MKYLFFDIECSDGYHICSFGYVLVDEKFNILEKDDIIINPESKFVLAPKKSRPKIQLAYSDEFFYKHGNFPTEYEQIKQILTRRKQIIFGHSIASDFRFLLYACKRYDLPELELEGYDTQKIYKTATDKATVQSLEKIVDELKIESDFQYHKSSDDAHATFLITKRLCKRDGLSLNEFIEKYKDCLVRTSDFAQKAVKERFVDKVAMLKTKYEKVKKKGYIAFSEVFNKFKMNEKLELVENVFRNGYVFTTSLKDCNIFVCDSEMTARKKFCDDLIKSGKRIKIISLEDFYNLLQRK